MLIYFITHPDVVIEPSIPVTDWRLSEQGLARMRLMLARPFVATLRAVRCSTERKAREGAQMLATAAHAPCREMAELGEIDRSSTGYLPAEEHESVADAFFANPDQSVRGWERAVDAQQRIIDAVGVVDRINRGNVAIVSHGAVGALLLCHLSGRPISRDADQPRNNGGNFFAFERTTMRLMHGWQPIDPPPLVFATEPIVPLRARGSAAHRR